MVCSYTLEDIRDPLWVFSEMIRSLRLAISRFHPTFGKPAGGFQRGIAGLSHHRWLIDIDPDGRSIRFLK